MRRSPVALAIALAALIGQATWCGYSHPGDLGVAALFAFTSAALCLAGYLGLWQRDVSRAAKPPEPNARYSSMVKAIPDVLIRVGKDQQVIDLHCPNGGAELVAWATANFSGAPVAALHPVIQAARGNGFALADLTPGDGTVKRIEVRAVADSPDEVLVMLRDASDRELLEQRLLDAERERLMAETRAVMAEADRLAALGTLAAGVAHEVNNPLAYISANLDFALGELKNEQPDLKEVADALKESAQGASRVRGIVNDMRGLSRRADDGDAGSVSIVRAVDAAVNLVRTTVKTATLETRFDEVPEVRGSESRLCQVLVNLIMNASQAMPARAKELNRVMISVEQSADGAVLLNVADNGAGMSEEVLGRVFDPFFTTKPIGEGTGLGLPISRTIVEGMGGTLSVTSQLGQGTTVTARFPPREKATAPKLRLVAV
ncbi:MAG: ATP-binding protein [Myxococcaceae bacterium]